MRVNILKSQPLMAIERKSTDWIRDSKKITNNASSLLYIYIYIYIYIYMYISVHIYMYNVNCFIENLAA